ncbi:ATP-binding protein [Algoriphagus sp. SE2]|uniref:ATP-binding protein n=1 Tax=Algoriphagus sp. SE2 TaxID=3141536 RepID=UPI0031CD0C83
MDRNKELLLNQTYQDFVNIGLNIKPIIDGIDEIIDPKIMGFGTTIDERIFSRKDFIDLIKRQEEQAIGLKMESKLEPVLRRVLEDENSAIYVDDLILKVTADKETLEMKLRFSTVLEYHQENWKVVHWHGSKPEEVKSEEDTWGIENWKQKARELERLVDEKTADLLEKNRELEIEAALERVRAKTMAMHSSEDMGNCILKMFNELTGLGVDEGTRFGIGILNKENKNNQLWTARKYGDKVKMHIGNLDMNSHPLLKSSYKAWEAQIPFHQYVLEGEDLLKYYQMLNKAPDYKIKIPLEKLPEKELQYCFIFEYGFFYAFTPRVFEQDLLQIIQRFSSLFAQTYRRYLDLIEAEAQAREAKIEAALEKVRSRSLAMQKSDELKEVVKVLFEKITELKVPSTAMGIQTFNENSRDIQCFVCGDVGTGLVINQYLLPYFNHPIVNDYHKVREKSMNFYVGTYTKKQKDSFYDFVLALPELNDLPDEVRIMIRESETYKISMVPAKNSVIAVNDFSGNPLSEIQISILQRFGKVFEQAYTRFLDLQKAEAQAREAKIEAALERVRSASMAMHQTEELQKVIFIVDDELKSLDILMDGSFIEIFDKSTDPDQTKIDGIKIWMANPTHQNSQLVHIPYFKSNVLDSVIDARKNKINFISDSYTKRVKNHFYRKIFELSDLKVTPKDQQDQLLKRTGFARSVALTKYAAITMFNWEGQPYTPEENKILERIAKVFDQTYTRFLDLQKAEEQAREAQIEAALERIRSRSMAMHKTSELSEVILVLFKQFEHLNLVVDTCYIDIFDENNQAFNLWIGASTAIYPKQVRLPYFDHPIHQLNKDARENGIDFFTFEEDKKSKEVYFEHFYPNAKGIEVPEDRKEYIAQGIGMTGSSALGIHSGITMFNYRKNIYSEEENNILKRINKVFQQTYTRFLDLQKAEEQAREAQIEAALERIRSASMAMHKSEELPQVALTFLTQIEELAIPVLGVALSEINPETNTCITYFADNTTEGQNRELIISEEFDVNEFWMAEESLKQMKSGKKIFTLTAEGERLELWIKWIDKIFSKKRAERLRSANLDTVFFHSHQFHEYSSILFSSLKPLSEEYRSVIQRLVNTFKLSYLRFLDLKKAEAQAREAQIEAALERVRAKAMSMHNSNDLAEANNVVFDELTQLGISPLRSGIGLIDKEKQKGQMFATVSAENGKNLLLIGEISLTNSVILESIFEYWTKKQMYHLKLNGQELNEYYDLLLPSYGNLPKPEFSKKDVQYGYFLPFNHGSFYAWTKQPFNEEELRTIQRFVQVINLTYNRYFDLQKAETQAREATKQASLDRVRAEIASMRDTKDLERITPLVWKELQSLGVPFFRCGVMLVNEKEEIVDFYLSNPKGEALAALHLDFDNSEISKNGVAHWRKKETYIEHWDQNQFLDFMKSLMEQGQISNATTYQGGEKPPRALTLQFVPFTQGMVYVGSEKDLSEEELDLVKALGNSLSVAYARYEDFTKLDLAKAKAEKALKDLKAAQEQLVQQEKLASLGQLTAGIAHEIKNPLNFVNNFSELNRELIEEVFEELENLEDSSAKKEIITILNDVKTNLTKVHEHGTRADSIVKSMLQHSRATGSKREPKAFNPLVKEFVNLSFHGMRAGKSPINVDIDFKLDPNVGDVNLISEDFSRVILNLCNNAFDAMRDKLKSSESEEYLPKLSVKTALQKDEIIFSIADNGPGIPENIKDKILQPFFTTKKGTEGTGLGLSITHDIIKAHGGELKVESKKGKGTEFFIRLKVENNDA